MGFSHLTDPLKSTGLKMFGWLDGAPGFNTSSHSYNWIWGKDNASLCLSSLWFLCSYVAEFGIILNAYYA